MSYQNQRESLHGERQWAWWKIHRTGRHKTWVLPQALVDDFVFLGRSRPPYDLFTYLQFNKIVLYDL